MKSAKTVNRENLQANIVIVGSGGAGLAAAVAAAEAEANNIILLEARHTMGGNAVFPIGIFAAESKIQKRLGIDARTDEVFKIAMQYAHWKINPRIVRALVDKSGDTIHWLESKGVEFSRVVPHYPNQVPEVFHIVSPPKRTGAEVVSALRENCTSLGIQALTHTEAKKLQTDKKGKIVGVLATTKDKELSISTKSVIMATGGFAGNTELLKKYIPAYNEAEIMHLRGTRYQGDGLRMISEIGGAIEDSIVLEMGAPRYAGPDSIALLTGKPNVLWVNKRGERFADEGLVFLFAEGANVVCRQPDKTCYVLFDERVRESIIAEGFDALGQVTVVDKAWLDGLAKDLQSQVDEGTVKIADSWGGIAEWIGVAPEVLLRTINEYNSSCDRGHDEIFAKDEKYLIPLKTPPYYAIKCGVDLLTTHGGIKVNHRMEVLNKQGMPIDGLYAAGVDIGGADADSYNLALSGHSFGFTINSGRIAGENAAKYVLEVNRQPK